MSNTISPTARNPELEARLERCFAHPPGPTRAGAGGTGWRRAGGGAIFAYDRCDSTMERAHALVREGIGEGAVVFAQRQEQGRGRLGRAWESPAGGVYFSLILKPTRPIAETPQLSLVAGLATAETVSEAFGRARPAMDARGELAEKNGREPKAPAPAEAIAIRWPNDVLIDGKKVAGILTEARGGAVVVGIGINVATDLKSLPDTATSLAAVGAACDPYQLVADVCRKFDGWYDIWTAQGFAPIRQALRPWLSHLGSLVQLKTGASETEGQATDLDEAGRLLVRLDSGVIRAFDAGEVTLLR